jgi:hypothetical protein
MQINQMTWMEKSDYIVNFTILLGDNWPNPNSNDRVVSKLTGYKGKETLATLKYAQEMKWIRLWIDEFDGKYRVALTPEGISNANKLIDK